MSFEIDSGLIYPSEEYVKNSHVPSLENYKKLYKESIKYPDKFWYSMAEKFNWKVKPSNRNTLNYNFNSLNGDIFINFLKDGVTNVCYNVLDIHVENGLGDKIAFYWEGNDTMDFNKYSYQYVYDEVCKFSNLLRARGIKKGDRVAIYMPMIIHLPIALLSCARIGAVHSVIFGGYSSDSIANRIVDGKCKMLITCDGSWRGTKLIRLKEIANDAMNICKERGFNVEKCIVVRHVTQPITGKTEEIIGCRPTRKYLVNMVNNRDEWWHDAISQANLAGPSPIEWVEAEHPLFILYTSGSTGIPKGVLHTTAGYMIFTAMTFKYTFDYHDDDIYWCTADIGWITGHSYVVYGPMAHGCTSVIFEGVPTYPDAGRTWSIIDKYSVSKFYTAPTAIRSLMRAGDSFVRSYSRQSLRVLGTVGEPINPRAWHWYYAVVGNKRCPIVDTFWQTETGGHVISPLPGATPLLPGSATLPYFGVEPALLDDKGVEIRGPGEGYLVFRKPWPGIMRTVYGNHERFQDTYFKKFNGYYTTGDGARRDKNGYYTITGRIDDMLNVSGHLISTAQVESALVNHAVVVEAAVVGAPHEIKGECLYCFVTRNAANTEPMNDELRRELIALVRSKIGPFAAPDFIQDAPILPKTRSGKIMRRILRKIVWNEKEFGDTSTLADPTVINEIVEAYRQLCPA